MKRPGGPAVTGWSRNTGDEQILVTFDPLAARQLLEQRAIEATGGAMVGYMIVLGKRWSSDNGVHTGSALRTP